MSEKPLRTYETEWTCSCVSRDVHRAIAVASHQVVTMGVWTAAMAVAWPSVAVAVGLIDTATSCEIVAALAVNGATWTLQPEVSVASTLASAVSDTVYTVRDISRWSVPASATFARHLRGAHVKEGII